MTKDFDANQKAHARYRNKPEKKALEKAYRERPEIKAKLRENSKRFHRTRLAHRIYLSAKRRAEKLGVPFEIIESDIVIPSHCPVLGIPLIVGSKDGSRHGGTRYSPSIDRVVSDRGYVKDNIHIISLRANGLKNSGTIEEFLAIVEYVKRSQPQS